MKKRAALYARVSSERQAEQKTINSQIEEIVNLLTNDGYKIDDEMRFIDDGYSGTTLIRPGLERLRDLVASGGVGIIYVHSPDRLSRKYAYQVLLVDEFKRAGVEVVFLNNTIADTPEGNLLLQMQGMIAEYERAKIVERNRRGKRHAASIGKASVLICAPYGFTYIRKQGNEGGIFAINEEEAKIVQQIFTWFGKDRISIKEICRRLTNNGIATRRKIGRWSHSTISNMLKNPAYKGMAAFGRRRVGQKRPRLRDHKGCPEHTKYQYSRYSQPEEQWIRIPVPQIVDESLFDVVQIQMKENAKRLRERASGPTFLLQGLVVCSHCGYAYCGGKSKKKYGYYRCLGADAYKCGGKKNL